MVIIAIVVFVGIFMTILVDSYKPVLEYEWKELPDPIELVPLTENDKTYAKISENRIVFRYLSESEFGEEKILSKIIENRNTFVEIKELEEGYPPYMVISECHIKDSSRVIATKYTFYLPKETIINEKVKEFTY